MLSMLGTWRLVAVRAFDPEGREVPSQYGHLPMGVVTFEPTRMMAVLGDSRPPAAGEARFYTSYTGPWTFDGATLVTRVDGCSDPARMGTDQIRQVRSEGEHVVLVPPPRLHQGVMQQPELVWERLA
ncbi:lipocalin-like domain-containing protein [Paeniroseomonas aquatica]|uniref:Lipocalin-like domain-containing protein n=1 Tax=Paeniroseomonas aquatica TaxID=373043 RepID=A0ABT8A3V3_9PROT|nr:lipocalin-like domain-containing protein [Paeniroseomonas aquatica]MDN3564473.1 lipocalin-like domain-containing protein [Paeniroseomonas aquatica]